MARCENVNECEQEDHGGCQHQCIDSHGSFHCHCAEGFRLDDNQRDCVDSNECLRSNGGCQPDAISVCINEAPGHRCECSNDLWTLAEDERTCVDVDECETEPNPCQQICENTQPGYRCSCESGFEQQGPACIEIDECVVSNFCEYKSLCLNTRGGYECFENARRWRSTTKS